MNILIDTATGPLLLTPSEARVRCAQIQRVLNWETDRERIEAFTREYDALQRVVDSSRTYADSYAPDDYVPGWSTC